MLLHQETANEFPLLVQVIAKTEPREKDQAVWTPKEILLAPTSIRVQALRAQLARLLLDNKPADDAGEHEVRVFNRYYKMRLHAIMHMHDPRVPTLAARGAQILLQDVDQALCALLRVPAIAQASRLHDGQYR